MGQLFTRISTTQRPEQQTSSIITQNNFITTKRKRIDQDIISKKRKILLNDNDNNVRLSFSSRMSKNTKVSKLINTSIISHSFSSMTIFKCQLCCRCFTSKDSYLDHMIICAIEHQASIKIVRAQKKLIHFSQ
ncbi:unnamed protein product [Rotaria sordida]|uniref:Uncharacterized protein n=1 Tax=Rotaria sordida TaxID=392033 RepID=A0A814SFQ9_9BILA|nr:unnamed protein product [Rotaria sordida]CAF0898962.1 unnamed protein product [Rotaria sordida]CAF1146657.1 unnamed protein product [Rotaria sordida]CAF1150557.1 unnamed protein product [Rotaria sordida]CAF1315984.1 unnamed protein product [Rotaria sordida]